jgi:uncharacterized protein YndB with AHSA1/START domain
MPALKGNSVANRGTETQFTLDRAGHAIVFVRTVSASREQVFESWTQADQVAQWWDPSGAKLAECTIDLKVGGGFKFVNQVSHGAPPFTGTYREITPPSRLVFEALGAIGRVLIETVGGKTQVTVRIECTSPEHLEQFVKMGVATGTAQTVDNLVGFVGG